MPSTRSLLGVAAVALVLAGAAAAGVFDTASPSDPRAVDIARRSADATANVSAYSFTVDGEVTARHDGEERRARFDGGGAFDRPSRRYAIHLELDGEAGGDAETRYVHGHRLYRPCPMSRYVNVENASYATSLPENRSWTAYTLLGGQRRVVDVSRLYYRGAETVEGNETHVVRVVPDPGELRRLTPGVPGEERENFNAGANVTATMYVDATTDLPRRIVVRRHRGGWGRPTIDERIVYAFSYGPTSVPWPDRTVESEDACPRP